MLPQIRFADCHVCGGRPVGFAYGVWLCLTHLTERRGAAA